MMLRDKLNLLLLAVLLPKTASSEVVISEILSHTDPPLEDAIELQNIGTTEVDISYWWLSDARGEPKKFQIPPGMILPPGSFIVFYQIQFQNAPNGFALNSANGDQVYLTAGDAQGNLTGHQTSATFGATANGVSIGRVPTTIGIDFVPLAYRTFGVDEPTSLPHFRQGRGLSNSPPRVGPVVISEIMFRPDGPKDSEANQYEYLELHNPTSQPVHFYDPLHPTNTWRMDDGLDFRFPLQFHLPPGGYALLVSFDPVLETNLLALFKTKYSVPAEIPILGPYGNRLSDRGETIELLMPDVPQGPTQPDAGYVPYLLVERIDYGLDNGWPTNTSGTGLSLQRRSMLAYGNEPTNWMAGPPSAGRKLQADSDSDGLPDEWEIAHGLDPLAASDAGLDPDGDHFNNQEEFIAGTDPQNPLSLLKIRHLARTEEGFLLSFMAEAGRDYFIQQQISNAWHTVTQMTHQVTGETQVKITPSLESSTIFRLAVSQAPIH